MQLVKPGLKIDFLVRRRFFAVLSSALVLTSMLLFVFVGPNWGIDFTGGTEIHLRFEDPVTMDEVRAAAGSMGLGQDAVQQVGPAEAQEFIIRIQDATFGSAELQEDVLKRLRGRFGDDWIVDQRFDAQIGARLTVEHRPPEVPMRDVSEALAGLSGVQVQDSPDENTFYVKLAGLSSAVSQAVATAVEGKRFQVLQVDSVGPKVGGDLRRQGFIAMFATLGLVLIYVGFRFDPTFAPGAIVALFHDVAVTLGVFVLLQEEVNLTMVGAILTIIGYSLNDTIVIFDRIRENQEKYRRSDLVGLINDSINETLARTLATTATTMVAVCSFLFLGGPVIGTFALALLIGMTAGTYSTIFIACPLILPMQKVKPVLARLLLPVDDSTPPANAEAPAPGSPAP